MYKSISENMVCIFITTLVFIFILNYQVQSENTVNNPSTGSQLIRKESLTDAIVAYTFALEYGNDLESLLDNKIFSKYYLEFQATETDINKRFSYPHKTYLIQSTSAGSYYGENSAFSLDDKLFVFTPLSEENNTIWIVYSSKDPDRTTVYTFDTYGKVVLKYDTLTANYEHMIYYCDKAYVAEEGVIQLIEKFSPGYSTNRKSRSMIINISSGEIEIKEDR